MSQRILPWDESATGPPLDAQQADDRLRAAATDMLVALKIADRRFCGTWWEGGTDHQVIRAAIAKATGGGSA